MNTPKKRVKMIAIAATFAFGLVVPTVGASAAWASVYDCTSGKICSWREPSYTGAFYSTLTKKVSTYPAIYNDDRSSLANNTAGRVWWYTDPGYNGGSIARNSGGVAEELFWLGFADVISSHYQ